MPYSDDDDRPSTLLEFVPDPDHAHGLVHADEPVSIRLSVNEDGLVIEGSYSTLYVASVMCAFDTRVRLKVAVKVFKSPVPEEDAFREYEMLSAFSGLDGFLPRAVAYGHVTVGGDHDRPAIMQEFVDGESVRDVALDLRYRFPNPAERLEEVLRMVRAIASAVAAINDTAEVRHGDLSHTNVLLVRDGVGGYKAVLIDLGQAALKQRPETYGKSGTEFFSAPELFGGGAPWREGDYARGRSSADVYSVGALWVFLLLRGNYAIDGEFLNDYHAARESRGNGIARWATPADVDDALLASTVGALIASCMRLDPTDRRSLSDVSDDLCNLCVPGLRTEACLSSILVSANGIHVMGDVLPSPYPIRPSLRIAGRDEELAQVARCLREGRVAYVCGFAGIGKSTLATAFATESLAIDGCHGVRAKRVYLLPFASSAAETLAGVASKLTDRFGRRGMDEAANWVLDVMEGALWPDDLVILDDVFVPGRTLMEVMGTLLNRMVRNGRYKLIITSRYPATGDVAGHVVRTYGLTDAALGEVFRMQAGPLPCDDVLLARLFASVDRNTLVVKLVGGLVNGGLVGLDEVVEVLEDGRLGNEMIDAHNIANCDDGVQANMRGHVARLLSLTADVLSAQERDLMSRLLMLPRQGVSVKTLGQVIRRERPELACAFATLRDKGLVERMPQGTRVRLHTLVRNVCLEAEGFAPPLDPSEGFLEELNRLAQDALEVANLAVVLDADAILRCAIELARQQGPDSFVDTLLRRRGEVLRELGRTSERLLVTEELLERLSSRLADAGSAAVGDEDAVAWAQAAADHSEALTDVGRFQDAIDQAMEALSVLGWDAGPHTRSMPPEEPSDTRRMLVARLLASRGAAAHELFARGRWSNLTGALEDKRQSFSIIAKVGDEWEMATSLKALSFTEYHAGEHSRAIRDAERAIALVTSSAHQPERERALLRATCLNYLGFFLCNADDFVEGRRGESLGLKEEAIRIRYRYLPPVHIDIARSHNNIAYSLWRLSWASDDSVMQQAALDHALVARRIRAELSRDGYRVSMSLVNNNIALMSKKMGLSREYVDERYEGTSIPAGYWRT